MASERSAKTYSDSICGQLRRLRDFEVDIRHVVLIRGMVKISELEGRDIKTLRDGALIASMYHYRSCHVVHDVAIFLLGERL